MTPEQYSYSLPSISQPPTLPQLDKYLKEDPQLSRWRARMHLALVYKGMESQMKRGRRNQVRTGIEREKYCSSPSIVTWILTIKHISTSLSKEEIEFHFLISHWVVISMLHLLTQTLFYFTIYSFSFTFLGQSIILSLNFIMKNNHRYTDYNI